MTAETQTLAAAPEPERTMYMKKPFSKSLGGKFILRTVMLVAAFSLVLAAVSIVALRSVSGSASDSVTSAQQNPSADAVVELERVANDISSTSSTFTLVIAAVVLISILAAAVLSRSFAQSITRPIRQLRGAAVQSATAISEIGESSTIDGLGGLTELPEISVVSGDEVEDLADSVTKVQRTATGLAISEANKRQHSAEQFVTLGRRSQALLREQMSLIEGMERDETNPENLQRLFQIDHLATRMRRTAESILVLADEASPRQLQRPVSMHQVVQAASSEIEHFNKITISHFAGVGVHGAIAMDLAHILAELLENATHFSPDGAPTTVAGVTTDYGYLVEIVDHGAGMEAHEIEMANQRFAQSVVAGIDPNPTSQLGLDVVARLALRHRIGVKIAATPTGGVTVQLYIPQHALAGVTAPQQAAPAAQPAATQPEPAAAAPATQPAPTQPAPTQPAPTQPAPTAAEPVTQPAPTQPAPATQPAPTQPAPAAAEPVTQPAPTQAAPATQPAPTQPAPAAEPVAAAPAAAVNWDQAAAGLTDDQQRAIDLAIDLATGPAMQKLSPPKPQPQPSASGAPAPGEMQLPAGPVEADALASIMEGQQVQT